MAAMLAMLPWAQGLTVTLPYTQNFDGASSISDLSGWRVYYQLDAAWTLNYGDNQSSSAPHSGSKNLYLFSTSRGSQSNIESPWFNCTNTSDNFVRVSFWYSNNAWSGDVDSLRVILFTTNNGTKVILRTGGTAHNWTQFTIDVDISDFNGNPFQILFVGNTNYGHGICIDDLSVSSYGISTYAYPAAGGSASVRSGSGTSCTLTATPASGYHFAYWSDNSSTTNPRTITSTGRTQSYAAVFSPNDNITDTNRTHTTVSPTITITASPHNSSYGSVAGGGTYRANETARLLAIPNEGYHFRRWSDGSTDNPHTVTVKGNKTFYAYFTEECNGSATSGTDTKTACDRYTWINGRIYTASTSTPTCTLTNRANCDSVVRLNLTIRNGTNTTYTVSSCDYYNWHDTQYRTSGTKTYNYNNSYGCASTETLNLTILNSTHNSTAVSACNSYTWHSTTYSTSGTKTYSYTNSYNCSSIDTLHLTIFPNNSGAYWKTAVDQYTWHGTTYTTSGTRSYTYFDVNGCSATATLHLTITPPPGTLNGYFTINTANQRVRFSQGNLQYTTTGTHAVATGDNAIGTWRFADTQEQYVGNGNANTSYTYTGWIDLFGWGTSGWYGSGANGYQPYSTSTNASDYVLGGSNSNSLIGDYIYADWGRFNAISNGGNVPGIWSTLSCAEWDHLLYLRSASTVNGTANARFARVVFNNVNGLLLFPDSFTLPSGVSAPTGINSTASITWENQTHYNYDQCRALEAAGCVFLPAAGYRSGTSMHYGQGVYWTSTGHSSTRDAYDVAVLDNQMYRITNYLIYRYYGASVRLVRRE